MSPCVDDFTQLEVSCVQDVRIADGSVVPVVGQGPVWVQGLGGTMMLHDVLFVPRLSAPLFSLVALYDEGGKATYVAYWQVDFVFRDPDMASRLRPSTGWSLSKSPRLRCVWEFEIWRFR